MTAVRRYMIRRIHRETGRSLLEILRNSRGLTAAEIARRYVQPLAPASQHYIPSF